ncbi:hypothetical protein NQ318_009258 [Aromia moschata]|uniref:HDAg domain-containing protein n=1 Tax=Aromia moschata TaxID=1265417 RepID=A0AAV8Y999_9CUCU|nr:hypothetical protein NQ318_009258 [Aromia moschata]
MANVRDSDTSLWLHNKLGISNDSWTGGSICSQLNVEVLRNIKDCFPDLQTQVKLKLLLSFFHIPRRNLEEEEWKSELEQILDVAVADSELWVAMLADALKTYPSSGSLNTEISDVDEVRPIFTDLVTDLRKLVRKQNDHTMLPMECHYLNKAALISVGNAEKNDGYHEPNFMKRIITGDETWVYEYDMQSSRQSSEWCYDELNPKKPRQTPLKGIPSRVPTSGFRSGVLNSNISNRPPLSRPPAGRKEGGVKLLDIADQPLGYAAAKKRKRMQEIEEAKKTSESTTLQSPPPASGTTPDYAAGLSATPAYAPATPQPTVTPTAVKISIKAAIRPVTTYGAETMCLTAKDRDRLRIFERKVIRRIAGPKRTDDGEYRRLNNKEIEELIGKEDIVRVIKAQRLRWWGHIQRREPTVLIRKVSNWTPPTNRPRGRPKERWQDQIMEDIKTLKIKDWKTTSPVATVLATSPSAPAQPTAAAAQQQPQQVVTAPPTPRPASHAPAHAARTIITTDQQTVVQAQQVVGTPVVVTQRPAQQQQTVTHIRIQPQPSSNVLQRRGLALTLTRRSDNEVDGHFPLPLEENKCWRPRTCSAPPTKSQGPRRRSYSASWRAPGDNPCPHLGNIVTIKLSEDQENVPQPDGTYLTMMVETHFQMNYNNGEWKRIKKYRHMENIVDQITTTAPPLRWSDTRPRREESLTTTVNLKENGCACRYTFTLQFQIFAIAFTKISEDSFNVGVNFYVTRGRDEFYRGCCVGHGINVEVSILLPQAFDIFITM